MRVTGLEGDVKGQTVGAAVAYLYFLDIVHVSRVYIQLLLLLLSENDKTPRWR